ncbi:MAG: hypothetical protein JXA72_12400 [Bacteroidales bacterium]|nr:hypothetical protein [Bacteroidales bacterium]
MKRHVFIVFVLLLAFSCEKEKEANFSGITERDIEGVSVGAIDDTDWRFDDVWNAKEESLFNEINFITKKSSRAESDDSPADFLLFCVAYPNPATSMFTFRLNSDADTVRFVIVDENYEIILTQKALGGDGSWGISTSSPGNFKSGNIYRIYYKLDYQSGNIERGHGDVMIKP